MRASCMLNKKKILGLRIVFARIFIFGLAGKFCAFIKQLKRFFIHVRYDVVQCLKKANRFLIFVFYLEDCTGVEEVWPGVKLKNEILLQNGFVFKIALLRLYVFCFLLLFLKCS